jgi:isocitrate dehydrogenase kinase/phosphatase
MRKIPIKTSEDKFFRQILELFRSLPPFNKLKPRELDILAQLLHYNNMNRDVDVKIRHVVVFSTELRKEMRENLGISVEVFNNNLSGLKKHKLITADNKLVPFLETLYFDKNFKLEFNFISNG